MRRMKKALAIILLGAFLITFIPLLGLPGIQSQVSAGTYGNSTGIVDVNGKLIYVENGEQNTSYTGLVKYSGKHYAVIKGAVDFSYTGIIQNKKNGNWHYVKNGIYVDTFTGISKRYGDSQDYYVLNGYNNPNYTGLIKSGGRYYAVIKGKINHSFTGIIQNKNNGNWHYFKNGSYDPSFTGIAKRVDDKQDYLVIKGYLDPKKNGLIKVGSKYYAINKGKVNYDFTGIVQNEANGNWHYVKNGIYDNTFTGIAKRIDNKKDYLVIKGYVKPGYDKELRKVGSKYYAIDVDRRVMYEYTGLIQNLSNRNWHYVKNGIYDSTYTGLVHDTNADKLVIKGKRENRDGLVKVGDKYYAMLNGIVYYEFTGLVQNKSNGNWHYVKNGVYDKTYTGLAKMYHGYYPTDTSDYYVKNGYWNPNYLGLIKYGDKHYAIRDGQIAHDFIGIIQNKANGNWHYVKKGIYDKTFTGFGESIVDGKYYYVVKGYTSMKYTGNVTHEGKVYKVTNSRAVGPGVSSNTTGMVKMYSDWLYYKNGYQDTSFYGLAPDVADGKLYYAMKGKRDWNYTSTATYNDKAYLVVDGAVKHTYNGLYVFDYSAAYFKNGVVDTSFSGAVTDKKTGKRYIIKNGYLKWDSGYYTDFNGNSNYTGNRYVCNSGIITPPKYSYEASFFKKPQLYGVTYFYLKTNNPYAPRIEVFHKDGAELRCGMTVSMFASPWDNPYEDLTFEGDIVGLSSDGKTFRPEGGIGKVKGGYLYDLSDFEWLYDRDKGDTMSPLEGDYYIRVTESDGGIVELGPIRFDYGWDDKKAWMQDIIDKNYKSGMTKEQHLRAICNYMEDLSVYQYDHYTLELLLTPNWKRAQPQYDSYASPYEIEEFGKMIGYPVDSCYDWYEYGSDRWSSIHFLAYSEQDDTYFQFCPSSNKVGNVPVNPIDFTTYKYYKTLKYTPAS